MAALPRADGKARFGSLPNRARKTGTPELARRVITAMPPLSRTPHRGKPSADVLPPSLRRANSQQRASIDARIKPIALSVPNTLLGGYCHPVQTRGRHDCTRRRSTVRWSHFLRPPFRKYSNIAPSNLAGQVAAQSLLISPATPILSSPVGIAVLGTAVNGSLAMPRLQLPRRCGLPVARLPPNRLQVA